MEWSRQLLALFAVLSPLGVAGCGGDTPFRIVPVSGKVTYADGSPIAGTEVRVTFVPQEASPVGQAHPMAAQGTLRPDGTFSELTSHHFGDGAIVGRHKVTVLAVDPMERPLDAVPARYRDASTTPLEATVEKGGKNYFELTVERGG